MNNENEIIIISVEGIVATRNQQPYIIIYKKFKGIEERITQMNVAEARNFAQDILNMCARTEADAIIFNFFNKNQFPKEAAGALMLEFRNFRASLDSQEVTKTQHKPIAEVIENIDFTKASKKKQ